MISDFKKKNWNNVENYRPVSFLPNLSKIYESCLYDQMYKFFNHYTLKMAMAMWNPWRLYYTTLSSCDDGKVAKIFGQRGISGATLTDLSKVLDRILHDPLIAKVAAYNFDYQPLRIMESFLSNRQQRTINNAFSRYSEIIHEVTGGSILDLLFFNIYISDINVISLLYEKDNTPYNFDFNLH